MIIVPINGIVSPDVVIEVTAINKGIKNAKKINCDHYDHKFKFVTVKDEVVIRREIRNSGYDFTTFRDGMLRIMWNN